MKEFMVHFKKFGKYTIVKKIASGGMADILLATDLGPTGVGRFVVIKRALAQFSENEEFIDMFKNEGKVACNLKHRNITPVYEFGMESNQLFLSMEYISGRNIRELIRKARSYKQSIDIPHAVYIGKETCSGLNYAHNAVDAATGQPLNIIHRDISPQNIMLSFDGDIKIIDFGIAKVADTNLTRAGHLKGKFSYMSPEQANGDSLDERTDIFCMGIILWELLTNKRLFASKNEMASLKKVRNCDVPDAQKINPKIPTALNDIIKKSLNKNRDFRYENASKLERDLSVFMNKTYPEYSSYDFINLIKKVFRKEIMEEREKLKNYSTDFKKYINSLNVEKSVVSTENIDFEVSNLWDEDLEKVETKSLLGTKSYLEDPDNLSDYIDAIEESSSGTPEKATEELDQQKVKINAEEDEGDTVLLSEQNEDKNKKTEDYQNPDGGEKVKKESANTASLKLNSNNQPKLILNENDFLQSTQSVFSTNVTDSKTAKDTFSASLYSKEKYLYEDAVDQSNRRKKLIFLIVASVLILGVFIQALFLIKNDYDILGLINKKQTPKSSPAYINNKPEDEFKTPIERQVSSTATVRQFFISSKPSGAAIYVDGKFSSKYTPSSVEIPLDSSNITLKKEGYIQKIIDLESTKNQNSLTVVLSVNETELKPSKIEIIE